MSDLEKIFLTSALTIFGSVIVYVIGQIFSKFIIEPIHEQKKLFGEIADSLIFYANIYANPGVTSKDEMDIASTTFRQQATLLQSKTHLIPIYDFFSRVGIVVSHANITNASSNLIRLSNSIHSLSDGESGNIGIRNSDTADEIKKLLNLKINS